MRDRDVRQALHETELKKYHEDESSRVLDELGLRHGTSRIDIAVVNGSLHGYEIKSEADTLERLAGQRMIYNAVLDHVTLVLGENHYSKAVRRIPAWWGIIIASNNSQGGITLEPKRRSEQNPSVQPIALAELLWRPEAVEILAELGVEGAVLRQPRAQLYRHLAEAVELDELRELVRNKLKARAGWRGQKQPSIGDGLSPPIPTSIDCP